MQLTHALRCPPAAVFMYLTDSARFVAAHPVIHRMETLGPNRYRVYERMLGVPFTYPATVTSDAATRTVTMRAVVAGLVHIEMTFVIEPTPTGCVVREDARFGGWLPVGALMEPLFRRLHARLFANIEAAINSGQG